MTRIITIITASLIWFSCSKQGESEKSEQSSSLAVDNAADAVQEEVSFKISFGEGTNLEPLMGYLVGHQVTLSLSRLGQTQEYVIPKVPKGSYDLLIVSEDQEGLSSGIRINGINFRDGETSKLEDVYLYEAASVSGNVSQIGSSVTGTSTVSIPGTHFQSEADDSGNFQIQGIPKGVHKLEYNATGFQNGSVDLLQLQPGDTLELPQMFLTDETDRGLFIGDSSSLNAVGIILNPPLNTNMVRISEDETFTGVSWQRLSTTVWYSFVDGGEKTLYVQFSQDETNISSVFSRTFTVTEP